MSTLLIDAHAHLWLSQDAEVNGLQIKTLTNGRSLFMGEVRQMLPPYMTDGRNSAEIFLSNMDYAQVTASVITQEYIDGIQNDYLMEVQQRYPDRFLCCGMVDMRRPGFYEEAAAMIDKGFRAIKIPAQRLITDTGRRWLTGDEMMQLFQLMQEKQIILSIDLADGATQVAEMEEIITACPSLKIAIGHFGMVTRSEWQEQIKLARHDHVMIESGGITWLFHAEFYPFTGAIWAIREAIGLVGINKLMWGSDYPRTMVAITYRMSYDFILRSSLLSDTEKAHFLGINAQKFYGFGAMPELPYIKNMSE
jgi:predicted TIM-barrel fold metal-dependent hydrolase